MADWHIGPILRSVGRQGGLFSLVVLELASGFTVVSCLVLACSWYLQVGHTRSGHEESDLIAVTLQRPAARRAEAAEDLPRIRATPAVLSVAPVSTMLVEQRWAFPAEFRARDGKVTAFGWTLHTSPSLFGTLGVAAIEGQLPQPGQETGRVVLSRCLRDRLFPGGPAVGRTVASEDAQPARVIAVIDDVVMSMPFMPGSACAAIQFDAVPGERERKYLVRAQPGQRDAVMAGLAARLGASDPDRSVSVMAFDSSRTRYHQIASGLVAVLSIFGLTVAVVTLMGAVAVSAFLVVARTRQIGVHRALGATRRDVIRNFAVEHSAAAALGTVLGLGMTLILFLLMRRVFLGVQLNWGYLAITAVLMWSQTTLAVLIPARRAARIAPSVATRAA